MNHNDILVKADLTSLDLITKFADYMIDNRSVSGGFELDELKTQLSYLKQVADKIYDDGNGPCYFIGKTIVRINEAILYYNELDMVNDYRVAFSVTINVADCVITDTYITAKNLLKLLTITTKK